MKIFKKEGLIYYLQTDCLRGEETGSAIEALYKAGASNVQVIPTTTKKNRPGNIFLIDAHPDCCEEVENAIILETHVTGWHCIRTEHRHLTVDYLRKTVKIKTASSEFETELEAKKSYGIETTIRPEHRSSAKLKDMLDSRGIKISILTCDKIIREIFENNLQEYCLK